MTFCCPGCGTELVCDSDSSGDSQRCPGCDQTICVYIRDRCTSARPDLYVETDFDTYEASSYWRRREPKGCAR